MCNQLGPLKLLVITDEHPKKFKLNSFGVRCCNCVLRMLSKDMVFLSDPFHHLFFLTFTSYGTGCLLDAEFRSVDASCFCSSLSLL